MPNRFCAICGKDLDESAPRFNMCLDCYLKENPLFMLPHIFELKICSECGSFTKHEEWRETNDLDTISILENALFYYLLDPITKKQAIEFNLFIDEGTIQYSSRHFINALDFEIEGYLKNEIKIKHSQRIRVKINHELCESCVKLRSGMYFKAIIQLRVDNRSYFDYLNDIIQDIHNFVEKLFENDHKQYIVKMEDTDYGIDLFLSTNELMNQIVSHLKNNYNFLMKKTKKLVSRDNQRGKNVYRLTTLLRFLPLKKGNKIKIEKNEEYTVRNITKKKIILLNKSGAKRVLDYEEFFNMNYSIKNRGINSE